MPTEKNKAATEHNEPEYAESINSLVKQNPYINETHICSGGGGETMVVYTHCAQLNRPTICKLCKREREKTLESGLVRIAIMLLGLGYAVLTDKSHETHMPHTIHSHASLQGGKEGQSA